MTGRRKVVVTVASAVGVVVLLGVVTVVLAPRWINLEPVRKRIESAASAALGGKVTVGRIELSFLPRLEIVVRKVELSGPGKVRGAVRSVGISPVLLSLLRGRFRLSTVRADGPELTIDIPETAKEQKPASGPDPLQSIPPLVASLASEKSGLDVEIRGGRVAASRNGVTLAVLSDLDVSVKVPPTGPRKLHADARVSASSLSLRRSDRQALEVDGLRIEGALDAGDGKTAVALSRLSTESPRFLAEVALSADGAAPQIDLTARGSGLDVTALRGKLLSFAGDDPTIAAIFEIFRAGTLTSFSFAAGGKTVGDLGIFERMSIQAVLAGGNVRIESVGLDLREASGNVAVERGVLSAEHAAARIGKSQASDGSVRIGLAANDDTLRVEATVRSDLAELPGILSRAVRGGSFNKELSLVEDLAGNATARITIGDRAGALETKVSVSEVQLSARYRRLPWPIRIQRGTFFYDGNRVGVIGLSGSVGSSTFSGLVARLRLGDSSLFERVSGRFDLTLDELFPWLASRKGMEALRAEITGLRGSIGLSVGGLSGPISRPVNWRYEAKGSLKDVLLETSFLPETLEVKSGDFQIDGESIRATGLQARTLDAALRVSGALDGLRRGPRKVEAVVDGETGPEAVRWIWEKASLPVEFIPAAPIALREVRVGLAGEETLTLAGGLAFRNGPRVTLDVLKDGKGTDVRQLAIADNLSDASISLGLRKTEYEVRFTGHLASATIEELLGRKSQGHGRIEGDFHALVPRDHLGKTSAGGMLKGSDFVIPTPAGEITIEILDVRAAGNRFTASSSSLALDEQRLSVTGDATLQDEGIVLDMDVAAGGISWDRVEKVLDRMNAEKRSAAGTKEGESSSFPVTGILRLSLGSFTYRDFAWKPVRADIVLAHESVSATVRKAEVCGISTTGELQFLPGGAVSAAARVASAGEDVNVPLSCLGFSKARMTGLYDLSLQAEGKGQAAAELPRVLQGPLTFQASKGKIGKASLLTRILAAVNVTDVFKGKTRDRLGEAMTFDEFTIVGQIQDGRVSIREAALKSPSFAMAGSGALSYLDKSLDFTVLVRPFSTTDKIIQAIPVLRHILGRNFLSVGVKVTGALDDPKIRLSGRKDVGQGLVNMLSRTVKLPVSVFDPPSP
ncbi:MAG TPA: AsmA-like C-terminal domain-containing protein [Thermoanaerobaculia bacterium]|nr:AsmA-like C-terminal domain-containing protein [Thermoanaerobaculia bacterium]